MYLVAFFVWFFWDRIIRRLDWPQTQYAFKDGPGPLIFLPTPLKSWDCKDALLCQDNVVVGMELGAKNPGNLLPGWTQVGDLHLRKWGTRNKAGFPKIQITGTGPFHL